MPRKIDSQLELFDCITCDKCIPVCQNDANFTFVLPQMRIPIVKAWHDGRAWRTRADGERTLAGHASGEVDLTCFRIMNWLRSAVLDRSRVDYVNCLEIGTPPGDAASRP